MMKRLLGIFLIIALALGIFSAFSVSASEDETPICYQQNDPRWGEIKVGEKTMAATACGILSLVNAVNYLNGSFIEPVELAEWAHENNSFNGTYGGGTMRWMLYPSVTEAFGEKYGFAISGCQDGDIYTETLKNHLISGGSAIVHCPGHFMAINGYDEASGRFLVYDSSATPDRNTTAAGDWLTADTINNTARSKVDWFCLVTKTGEGTGTGPSLQSISATVRRSGGVVCFENGEATMIAKAGEEVLFRAIPDEGYIVSKILVDGTELQIKDGGIESEYSIIMPDGNCKIEVLFKKGTPATEATTEEPTEEPTEAPTEVTSEETTDPVEETQEKTETDTDTEKTTNGGCQASSIGALALVLSIGACACLIKKRK